MTEAGELYSTLVSKLSQLCSDLDYPTFLYEWHELNDGLAGIRDGFYPLMFERLHQREPREVIIEIANEFIKNYNCSTESVSRYPGG